MRRASPAAQPARWPQVMTPGAAAAGQMTLPTRAAAPRGPGPSVAKLTLMATHDGRRRARRFRSARWTRRCNSCRNEAARERHTGRVLQARAAAGTHSPGERPAREHRPRASSPPGDWPDEAIRNNRRSAAVPSANNSARLPRPDKGNSPQVETRCWRAQLPSSRLPALTIRAEESPKS